MDGLTLEPNTMYRLTADAHSKVNVIPEAGTYLLAFVGTVFVVYAAGSGSSLKGPMRPWRHKWVDHWRKNSKMDAARYEVFAGDGK